MAAARYQPVGQGLVSVVSPVPAMRRWGYDRTTAKPQDKQASHDIRQISAAALQYLLDNLLHQDLQHSLISE